MRSSERGDVARLFEAVELPAADAIARRASRHLRADRASHPGVDPADYLIGATAKDHGMKLGLNTDRVRTYRQQRCVHHPQHPSPPSVGQDLPGRLRTL